MSDAVSFDAKPDFVPHGNPFKRLAQHPVGFWFVFAGELAERASYYGMRTILALYLTTKMGFSQGEGATVMKVFMASCYLTPYLGGWIADRYLGRFRTIAYYSIPYILGHLILGGFENRFALTIALILLALGSGAIKPNTSVLMGQMYEDAGKQTLLTEAFSLFYMAVNIGAATTALSLPVVRNIYGYGVALMIPAVLMAVAFGFFVLGKRYYPEERIGESRAKEPAEAGVLFHLGEAFVVLGFLWILYGLLLKSAAQGSLDVLGVSLDLPTLQRASAVFALLLTPILLWAISLRRSNRLRPENASRVLGAVIPTAVGVGALEAMSFLPTSLRDLHVWHVPVGSLIVTVLPTIGAGIAIGLLGFSTFGAANRLIKTPEQSAAEGATLKRVFGIFALIAVFWLIYDQNADTWIYFADHHGKGVFDAVQKVGHLFAIPGYTLMVPAWLVYLFGIPALTILIVYALFWFVREVKQKPLPAGSGTKTLLAVGFWGVLCVVFQLVHPIAHKLDWSWNGTITGDQVQGLNPLFIIALTPIFNFMWNRWKRARGGRDVPDTTKMMIGFIIVIATALLMTIAGFLARSGQVNVWWVIIATFVVTLAELCISVVGLEFAYKVAAPGTKSVVTGAFHSTVFFGDSVGAVIAPFYENGLPPFGYFGLQAVLMTIASVLFLPISRRFQRHADAGASATT